MNHKITSFFIAGLKHYRWADVPGELRSGDFLFLQREPTNEYDPMAVKILAIGNDNLLYMIGYVPKEQTYLLHNYREAGIPVRAVLLSFNSSLPLHKAALVVVNAERELKQVENSPEFINS